MIGVKLEGFDRFRRKLVLAVPYIQRNNKRIIKEAARETQREIRAQFGPQVTNAKSRKRPGGNRLGTFTGRARRNIRTRYLFRNPTRLMAYVGPPGEIGSGRWQSGRAWYLRFHEFGIGGMPRRSTIRLGERRARGKVTKILSRTNKIFK